MEIIKRVKPKFRVRVIEIATNKSVSVALGDHYKLTKEQLMDIIVKKLEEHKV